MQADKHRQREKGEGSWHFKRFSKVVLAQRRVGELDSPEASEYFIRQHYAEDQKPENQELP